MFRFGRKVTLPRYLRLLLLTVPTKFDTFLLVVGLLSAIVSGVPFPLVGILFGNLINDFNSATCQTSKTSASADESYQSDVDRNILLIVYLAIAQFAAIYIHLVCWSWRGSRLSHRLREHYLYKLLHKDATVFDNLPAGEVSSRLQADIQTIRAGTSEKVGVCISTASFFVTAYIVAFLKHKELAGMLVSLLPAYMIMSLVGGYFIEKYSGLVSESVASAASIASESLSNILVVHAFNLNTRLEKSFAETIVDVRKQGIKKGIATGAQAGLMYFIAYAANALAFWQGSKIVASSLGQKDVGGAMVGSVFTVIFILVEATLALSQVAPFLQVFSAASGAFAKLQQDIDRDSEINGVDVTEGKFLSNITGGFEFRDVSFSYPSRREHDVLKNVSLQIPAGKSTAIVGLSGSGKSTVARLVTKLYNPVHGSLLFDGEDIRNINTRHLRSLIGVVYQEAALLDRSILENIAHGLVNSPSHSHLEPILLGPDLALIAQAVRNGKKLESVAQELGPLLQEIVQLVLTAANDANALEFVTSLNEGFGTVVGSSGKLLSGGQRSRIAIARALIKNPKILVLDEATAALDSVTENKIVKRLQDITRGKTVITIAHRLSTVKNADNIVLMRDGLIVEQGSHEVLISYESAYAQLVDLQNLSPTQAGSDDSWKRNSESSAESATLPKNSIVNEKETSSTEKVAGDDEPNSDVPRENGENLGAGEISRKPSTWSIARGLWPMIRPHLLAIAIALSASVIVGGAFSAEAVIFGNTVSGLSPCKTEESVLSSGRFFGLMFFILAIIEFFANFLSWSAFGWVAENTLSAVRVLSFRSLFEQDLHWHQSKGRTPANLLPLITTDANLLGGLSGSVLGVAASIAVNLLVAIILTNIIAWKIALVCLSVAPILLGVGLMQLRVLTKFEERHEAAYANSVGIGIEAVNQNNTISSLSLEDETMAVYRRSLEAPRKEITRVTFHANIWLALSYLAGNFAYALAYWWGSKQIIEGTYTQVQFLIVVFSLLVSAQLWSEMFVLAPELSNARGAAARILGLLELGSAHRRSGKGVAATLVPSLSKDLEKDVEDEAESKTSSVVASNNGVDVKFEHVSFAYPSRLDRQVINDLSLRVLPGQFCALVGPSGTGKSTIISLLERFYNPQSGSIVIDGKDITKSKDLSFRDSISLVPQDGQLFNGTIRFNVSLGARHGESVTDAQIEDACRTANVHDVIMSFPDGYNTDCGPNGGRLSGGQRQRLCIARALIRKPRLLILDEPTSALDAESEKLLQDGLTKASFGITVIVIAHRLHTVQKADAIFVIENGRCVDEGTHADLSERSESYRTNVLHQQLLSASNE